MQSKFIEGGLNRSLTYDERETLIWLGYYIANQRNYSETAIRKAAKIVSDVLSDKTESKVYSQWICNIAEGKDYDFHKAQFFLIELLQHK